MAGWEIERIEGGRYRCPAAAQIKPDLKTIPAKVKHRMLRTFATSSASMIKLTTIVARRG
jgi:hypothetical protein